MKFRIDISIDDGVPEGTALLFILAEIIKDVPGIIDSKAQLTTTEEIFGGNTYLGDVKAVTRRMNSERIPKKPKIPKRTATPKA